VILPDTRPPRGQQGDRPTILADPVTGALWRPKTNDADPRAAAQLAEAARRQEEEDQRLLYVAMTRAESWLIVAGAGDMGKAEGGSGRAWHRMVERAMEAVGAAAFETPAGPGLSFCDPARWNAPPCVEGEAGASPRANLPDWAREPPPKAAEEAPPLSPSDLGGPKALPGGWDGFDEAAALSRGRRLHLLLEHLPAHPPGARPAIAARLLASGPDAATAAEAEALAREAGRILSDPAFAALFAPGSLAEVPFAAELPELGGRRVIGAIDRLAVTPDRVFFADFKTNALVPSRPEEVPEGILRQMAVYAACLGRIYPGRRIEGAILWTAAPALMPLPPGLLAAALGRAARLDDGEAGP
jgi:ATP-dependent helicase/nuclease subunit A